MQTNRILALTLIVACFFAAIVAARQPTVVAPPQEAIAPPSLNGDFLSRVTNDRIVVVALQGAISGDALGVTGASALAERLRKLADNERVKGIVLQVNSPGGTVGASQELYRAVEKVREEKPIVTTVTDVAASGGYYVASATDEIIANPGSLVGSIGVIIQGFNAAQLLENIGVDPQTIKTGPFKDLLSPTRALTPEGRQLLQDLVDNSYGQFIGAVATGRQHLRPDIDKILDEAAIAKREEMTEARVRTFADGRVFTGEQAFDAGLIDSLGGIDEAVEHLRTLIGDADIQVSRDLPDLNVFWDIFRSQLSAWMPAFGPWLAPLQSNSVPVRLGTEAVSSQVFNPQAAFSSKSVHSKTVFSSDVAPLLWQSDVLPASVH
ncbi:MAG: signal peptide peptidase SppA [Cyanobacteria bacterium P01_E01_bin.45]